MTEFTYNIISVGVKMWQKKKKKTIHYSDNFVCLWSVSLPLVIMLIRRDNMTYEIGCVLHEGFSVLKGINRFTEWCQIVFYTSIYTAF